MKVTVTLPVESVEAIPRLVADGKADSVSGFLPSQQNPARQLTSHGPKSTTAVPGGITESAPEPNNSAIHSAGEVEDAASQVLSAVRDGTGRYCCRGAPRWVRAACTAIADGNAARVSAPEIPRSWWTARRIFLPWNRSNWFP